MAKKVIILIMLHLAIFSITSIAQQTGNLKGVVIVEDTGEPLTGANIVIRGTSFGAASNLEGEYDISGIRVGEYSVEVSYLGFERMLFTGVIIHHDETTELNIEMREASLTTEEEIIVVGKRPVFDVEESATIQGMDRAQISAAGLRNVEDVVGMQAGVIQDPTGLYIRSGRASETGFIIDGVSAQDPLAGTGFGIDLGSSAFQNVEVTTGGVGVEHGQVTSGMVAVETQEGGEEYAGFFSHKRDNFGNSPNGQTSNFYTSVYEINLGGPSQLYRNILPSLGINLPGRLNFFVSGQAQVSDEFYGVTANQLHTSMINSTFLAPRMDNRWSGMGKLTWRPQPNIRLDLAYQRSLAINQNTRMLRVVGDNTAIRPGFQFFFMNQLENANTYAHDSKMAYIRWRHAIDSKTFYDVQVSRLFTRLRADANGRHWRPEQVEGEFDPASITTYPIDVFETDRDFKYSLAGPGLMNNFGLATLWHDHFAEEITVRGNIMREFFNGTNRLQVGFESTFLDYQWIDITRPWVGAPIQIGEDEFTQTSRLGTTADIWNVQPARGALYVSDYIRYRGLVANFGTRVEYWFPGKYVDDAVENPMAPIPDRIREDYRNDTDVIFGRRAKIRVLPRIRVSFPLRENQVMYFSYSHKTKLPHPTHVYAGLDPFFQDRSFLSSLGNPNLDPEVDISYEIGIRNQFTSNDALSISAFWSDKYDFVTSERVIIEDATGRETSRSFRINGDFARVRGVEVTYIKRHSDWFQGRANVTYSIAEGLSSTANDAIRDLIERGTDFGSNVETPLAWDRPLDIRMQSTFSYDRSQPLFDFRPLNKMQLHVNATYRSGTRFTPYLFQGLSSHPVTGEQTWRPIYERDENPAARFSETGPEWIMVNANFRRWFTFGNDIKVEFSLEIDNLLNGKNPAIINPVTGKAYRTDYPQSQEELVALRNDRSYDVPSNVRDPRYRDPRDNNRPSYLNPANFLPQRQIIFGLSINF